MARAVAFVRPKEMRPWHWNVVCRGDGTRLMLTAGNNFDLLLLSYDFVRRALRARLYGAAAPPSPAMQVLSLTGNDPSREVELVGRRMRAEHLF